MNIEISTSETSATLAERDYIYHRLQNALSEHEAQITQAQVWIVGIVCADAQDAQYALINVKLDDGNLIACDGTDADLKTAINYATQRLCLEVTRNLEQRQKTGGEQIDPAAPWYRNAAATDYRQETI